MRIGIVLAAWLLSTCTQPPKEAVTVATQPQTIEYFAPEEMPQDVCTNPPDAYEGNTIDQCSFGTDTEVCCGYSGVKDGEGGSIWGCAMVSCRERCNGPWKVVSMSCMQVIKGTKDSKEL